MQLADDTRTALAAEFIDIVDAGVGTAVIRLRTVAPATIFDWDLPSPPFVAGATGVVAVDAGSLPITSSAAGADATADHALILNKDGTLVATLGINTSGSPDLTVSTTAILNTMTMELRNYSVTVPAGTVTT